MASSAGTTNPATHFSSLAFAAYNDCVGSELSSFDSTQSRLGDLLKSSLDDERKRQEDILKQQGGRKRARMSPEKSVKLSSPSETKGSALSAMSMPYGRDSVGANIGNRPAPVESLSRGFLFHPGERDAEDLAVTKSSKKKGRKQRSASAGSSGSMEEDNIIYNAGGWGSQAKVYSSKDEDIVYEDPRVKSNRDPDDSDADSLVDELEGYVPEELGKRRVRSTMSEAVSELREYAKVFHIGDQVDVLAIQANMSKRVKAGSIAAVNEDGTYDVRVLNTGKVVKGVDIDDIEKAEDDLDLR